MKRHFISVSIMVFFDRMKTWFEIDLTWNTYVDYLLKKNKKY